MENNVKDKKALARQDRAANSRNAAAARKLGRGKTKIQESRGDKIMLAITDVILVLVLIIVGYPVVYVLSCSFSSNEALQAGRVFLFPVDPSLASYEFVFKYEIIWRGYRNTIFYTIFGTLSTMIVQTLAAYPLAKRNYQGRGFITMVFFMTRLLAAGMIPNLLVRSSLGLRNNVFAVLTFELVGASNILIQRTGFRTNVPDDLFDAAAIDGASEFQQLTKIGLPLIKANLSVLTLYSAIGNWNEYFRSMIYLPARPDLWPLQLVLRPIMTTAQQLSQEGMTSTQQEALANAGTEGVIFALIVMATVPVLLMYSVVQKSFKTGVTVGAVKG